MTTQERLQFDIEQERLRQAANDPGSVARPQTINDSQQHPNLLGTPTPQSNVPSAEPKKTDTLPDELLKNIHDMLEHLNRAVQQQTARVDEHSQQLTKRIGSTEAFTRATYEKLLEREEASRRRSEGERRKPRESVSPLGHLTLAFLGGLAGAFGFYAAWWIIQTWL